MLKGGSSTQAKNYSNESRKQADELTKSEIET
jgi:hypothetical protein